MATKNGLTEAEIAFLRAASNCTDSAGLPIRASEGGLVMSLERAKLIRVIGEHQNRVCILPLGKAALQSVAA